MSLYIRYPSSGGITSINGLVGPSLTLAAGTGISISSVGSTITITNTSPAPSTGNLTDAGTDGIVITGGTGAVIGSGTSIAQHVADTTHNGYLNSTDWNTFNNKQPALGFTPENVANKGAANGYAPLDGSAKVPYTNLPSALMTFKGAWDPTTNTPTLTNGSGLAGDTYRASVGGVSTSPIADTWFAGDFIIYNGTIWQRSPLADGVISVNGMAGAVILTQGNLTDVGTDGITITGGTNAVWGSGTSIAQHVADTTHNGYLSSTDWNTFNGKQTAGSYITALTGDVTASGPGSVAATLATVNANVGSFGSSTSIPSFTVNAKGLITAAAGNVVIAPAGTLTGTTLAANVVTSSLTTVGTIGTGTWQGTAVAIGFGGTGQTSKAAGFDALQPMTTGGDIIYGGASGTGTRLANGSAGQVLTSNGTTLAPSWQTNTSTGPRSEIAMDTGNGHGSSNTTVRRFANSRVSTGSDITYATSSTLGDTFTINTAGVYSITYCDANSAAGDTAFGVTVNGSALTTNINNITYAQGKRTISFTRNGGANYAFCCSVTLILAVNDVIRAQDDTNATSTADDVIFHITKVSN